MAIPNDINAELTTLANSKANIKNAIIAKGVEVSSSDPLSDYDDKISAITPNLGTKTITTNDTYTATDDNLEGYSSVTVNVPTDDVSYSAWDARVLRDYTDTTVDTTKFYSIEAPDSFPSSGWTSGDFRNVRSIRFANNYFLGHSGKTYDNIRFDNLKTIGTTQYNAGCSYFMQYRNGLTLTFPELLTITINDYPFGYATNCTYTFPKLTRLSANYFGYYSNGTSFSFPALQSMLGSYSFYGCDNCTFSLPELTSIGSYPFQSLSGNSIINLPKISGSISCSFPANNPANSNTYTLGGTSINLGNLPYNTNSNKGSVTINIPNATSLDFRLTSSNYTSDNHYSTLTINGPTNTFSSVNTYFAQYLSPNNIATVQNLLNKVSAITSNYAFSYCSVPTLVLPEVTSITSRYILQSSSSTTRLDLPKCTTISNNYAFSNSSLTEIHFASANRSAIEASSGYSTVWGRGSSNCTVYFDL